MIFPIHSRNAGYIPLRNYCLGKGYIKETSVASNQYVIDSDGEDYLDLCLNPESLPHTNAIKKHTIVYHIGTCIVKILQTDWVKLTITAIIGLIIGTLALVHYHVIK